MKKFAKKKRIWILVLLTLALVISLYLLLRNNVPPEIDLSLAEEVFLLTESEPIPLAETEAMDVMAIFSDIEAYPANMALPGCPFSEAFLFRLPERDVVLLYSNDDCGAIRMQPYGMGGPTFWFTAYNPVEGAEYLRRLYQKYGLWAI